VTAKIKVASARRRTKMLFMPHAIKGRGLSPASAETVARRLQSLQP
jgi:hypothetical protein